MLLIMEKIISDKTTLISGLYMYMSFMDIDILIKITTGILTIIYLIYRIINEKNKINKDGEFN